MAVSLTPAEVRVKYFSFFMSAQGLWADIFFMFRPMQRANFIGGETIA